MEFRLPRFKRTPPLETIQLTETDFQIFRLLNRHRFLRSSQIISLMGGNRQQILRRLKLLYHSGYLERPRAQLDYYHQGGSREIIYGLGNKGGTWLRNEYGIAFPPESWGAKNRAVGRIFLEHAVLVSDIMVKIELACRNNGVRLLTESDLSPKPFRWWVKLSGGTKLGVVPDRVFALEKADKSRAYFFLEADRGTMPVKRAMLAQTSMYRKMLAYHATWKSKLHAKLFGFNRFRVLIVTQSSSRLDSLLKACRELGHGHGLFLFIDQPSLTEDMLNLRWQSGRPGETGTLLD